MCTMYLLSQCLCDSWFLGLFPGLPRKCVVSLVQVFFCLYVQSSVFPVSCLLGLRFHACPGFSCLILIVLVLCQCFLLCFLRLITLLFPIPSLPSVCIYSVFPSVPGRSVCLFISIIYINNIYFIYPRGEIPLCI